MPYSIRSISYFTVWGLIYGLLLGAFAGTAIYPYFGTIYSVFWGPGIGAACGLLTGVIAAVVQASMFHLDMDLTSSRRKMALGIGAVTGLAAPILLIATTRGFLWGTGMLSDIQPFTALSLFASAFWGSLSSAYIASDHPQLIARLTARRDYADIDLDIPKPSYEVSNAMRRLLRYSLNRWVMGLAAVLGAVMYGLVMGSLRPNLTSLITSFAGGALLGIVGAFFMALYVAFGNAALVTFLKRLILREYFPHMPAQWSRWTLTVSAFVFSGAITYWTFFLAPVIALITAVCVYHTLALPDKAPDKAKRKEKNVLALEENMAEEEDHIALMESERLMRTDQ